MFHSAVQLTRIGCHSAWLASDCVEQAIDEHSGISTCLDHQACAVQPSQGAGCHQGREHTSRKALRSLQVRAAHMLNKNASLAAQQNAPLGPPLPSKRALTGRRLWRRRKRPQRQQPTRQSSLWVVMMTVELPLHVHALSRPRMHMLLRPQHHHPVPHSLLS